jgi:hypothetical protein
MLEPDFIVHICPECGHAQHYKPLRKVSEDMMDDESYRSVVDLIAERLSIFGDIGEGEGRSQ